MTKRRKAKRQRSVVKGRGAKIDVVGVIVKTLVAALVACLAISVGLAVFNLSHAQLGDKSLSNSAKDRYLIETSGLEKTIVVLEDEVGDITQAWQVIYDAETADMIVYYIPPWVYSPDYSQIFDQYISVSDYKYAGYLFEEGREIEYSLWQLINLTGIPTDSYIWIENEFISSAGIELEGDISDLSRVLSVFSPTKLIFDSAMMRDISNTVSSNLDGVGLYRRGRSINSVYTAGYSEIIDLTEKYATVDAVSDSGDLIKVVNQAEVDRELDKLLYIVRNRDLEKEQVKVEVFNGSTIGGAASRYARRIQNAGLKVVRYDNAPARYEKTLIYVSDKDRFNDSLELASELMAIDVDITTEVPSFMITGDIVIILGQDLEGEMTWKK